jgi:hypothetical protein
VIWHLTVQAVIQVMLSGYWDWLSQKDMMMIIFLFIPYCVCGGLAAERIPGKSTLTHVHSLMGDTCAYLLLLMSWTCGFYSKAASIWNIAQVTRLLEIVLLMYFFFLILAVGSWWINKLPLSAADMAWVEFQEHVEEHACLLFYSLWHFGCALNY